MGICLIYDHSFNEVESWTCCNDEVLMLSALSTDNCWLVGCLTQVNLYCNSTSNVTSYDLSRYQATSSTLEYIPIWPYLDIHIQPSTVITCDISNYSFACSTFSANISEMTVQWIGEHHQSVKALTYGNMSKVFAYTLN